MASHGALKESAAREPRPPKAPAKKLSGIMFKQLKEGGLLAEHHYEMHGPEQVATVSTKEEAAEHLGKHFGLSMPSKSGKENAESEEQET